MTAQYHGLPAGPQPVTWTPEREARGRSPARRTVPCITRGCPARLLPHEGVRGLCPMCLHGEAGPAPGWVRDLVWNRLGGDPGEGEAEDEGP